MNWISKWFGIKTRRQSKRVVLQAHQIQLRDGAAQALRFLADSPEPYSEPVIQAMLAITYGKVRDFESLLNDASFDPIFSQCDSCNNNWLIPPSANIPKSMRPELSYIGVQCNSCGRVLCPTCVKITGLRCRCGKKFAVIQRPNGRKRKKLLKSEPQSANLPWQQANTLLESYMPLYLYYGSDDPIPMAVDSTFPLRQTATAEDHLDWAEILLDSGCYHQVQQQLDIVGQPKDSELAKVQWLRARLELVQFQNARRLSHEHHFSRFLPEDWYEAPKRIKHLLEESVRLSPVLGKAWLLAAEVYSTPEWTPDFGRALECAQQAELCLGENPSVLLLKIRILRALGQSREAVSLVDRISVDAITDETLTKEWEVATWERRWYDDPTDADNSLKLGRWYLRSKQVVLARHLFSELVRLAPDHPAGYYGLAKLAFINYELSGADRFNEVYHLCQSALKQDPKFGLAYELLGILFWNLSGSSSQGTDLIFRVEEPIGYFERAIELDPTCDIALYYLGDAYINKGQLKPALTVLEQAVALDTDSSSVYFFLAAIYMGLREYEKQVWAYKKAKDLSPHTQLSAEYEQKILRLCSLEN